MEKTMKEILGRRVLMTEKKGAPLMILTRMAPAGMGIWDNVWPWLAEHFTLANLELPAPSLDDYPSPKALFSQLADEVVAVAQALGYETFHFFGWTGGAQVGLRCLVDHGKRVRSAILLGAPNPPREKRPTQFTDELLKTILDHGDLELYTYFWFMSQLTPDYFEAEFDKVERLVDARLAADRGRLDTGRVLAWLKAIRAVSVSDGELASITTPTLLLAPAFEAAPRVPHVMKLAAKIKTVEVALIPRGGGMVLYEAPERFMAAAGRFLRAAASEPAPLPRLERSAESRLNLAESQVHYIENKPAEAVVFLHGWLMSPAMWAPSMAALSGVRSIALWQPAHGLTDAPGQGFDMAAWVDWLKTRLDRLGVERAVLVGHSMGGMLAMNFALAHPQMVSGLALVSTQDQAWEEEKRLGFMAAGQAAARMWGPELAAQAAQMLMGQRFIAQNPGWLEDWTQEVAGYDLEGMVHVCQAVSERPDASGGLAGLNLPVMVAHGGQDTGILPQTAREMAQRLGAPFTLFEDAAHCPPLEAPEEFAGQLAAFLAERGLVRMG